MVSIKQVKLTCFLQFEATFVLETEDGYVFGLPSEMTNGTNGLCLVINNQGSRIEDCSLCGVEGYSKQNQKNGMT